MLELQVIVMLRYSWIDMYSAHTLVLRVSSMLALMSQIYCCWSAESLENCELFLSQHDWKVNLNIKYYSEILNFSVSEVFLCNHFSDVISCYLNFNKHSWLLWVCKRIFFQLWLNSSLFLSKIKDQNKQIEKWESWLI